MLLNLIAGDVLALNHDLADFIHDNLDLLSLLDAGVGPPILRFLPSDHGFNALALDQKVHRQHFRHVLRPRCQVTDL